MSDYLKARSYDLNESLVRADCVKRTRAAEKRWLDLRDKWADREMLIAQLYAVAILAASDEEPERRKSEARRVVSEVESHIAGA